MVVIKKQVIILLCLFMVVPLLCPPKARVSGPKATLLKKYSQRYLFEPLFDLLNNTGLEDAVVLGVDGDVNVIIRIVKEMVIQSRVGGYSEDIDYILSLTEFPFDTDPFTLGIMYGLCKDLCFELTEKDERAFYASCNNLQQRNGVMGVALEMLMAFFEGRKLGVVLRGQSLLRDCKLNADFFEEFKAGLAEGDGSLSGYLTAENAYGAGERMKKSLREELVARSVLAEELASLDLGASSRSSRVPRSQGKKKKRVVSRVAAPTVELVEPSYDDPKNKWTGPSGVLESASPDYFDEDCFGDSAEWVQVVRQRRSKPRVLKERDVVPSEASLFKSAGESDVEEVDIESKPLDVQGRTGTRLSYRDVCIGKIKHMPLPVIEVLEADKVDTAHYVEPSLSPSSDGGATSVSLASDRSLLNLSVDISSFGLQLDSSVGVVGASAVATEVAVASMEQGSLEPAAAASSVAVGLQQPAPAQNRSRRRSRRRPAISDVAAPRIQHRVPVFSMPSEYRHRLMYVDGYLRGVAAGQSGHLVEWWKLEAVRQIGFWATHGGDLLALWGGFSEGISLGERLEALKSLTLEDRLPEVSSIREMVIRHHSLSVYVKEAICSKLLGVVCDKTITLPSSS